MCNEAENMKGNCPSVTKFFLREILPDTLVENSGTGLETKGGNQSIKEKSCRSSGLMRKNDGHMTNRIMKSGNFVKVVESGASAKKGKKGGHQFFSNEEGIKNLVQMQEDKGGHLCMP